MEKAKINPIQQQTMVQGQPGNLHYRPINTQAQLAAGLSELSSNLGNVLYEQNKRLEKLKFADNDEKLKITAAEMNLALSKAKNQEDFDAIKKDYMDRMKADSKFRLGKSYDKWEGLEGQNFMAAMEVDVKGHQIALNDKIAKETANSTVKDFSYQWAYAKTDKEREVQDAVVADYFANSDFNDAEKEAFMRKYNHDKEHGYLTVAVETNPSKVKKLLADPKNYDNLTVEEREAFKKRAESIEKEQKAALDKGFDDMTSLTIGSVKSKQKEKLFMDIGYIKSAGSGKNIDTDKLDYTHLMSTLDYIDALSKDPLKIDDVVVQTPSGQVTYTLTQEEALKYKRELMPYLMTATQAMLDGDTGVSNNSVYSKQLGILTEAAKNSGKMTALEISDLMAALWRENMKDDGADVKGADGKEHFVERYGRGWATQNLKEINKGTKDELLRAGVKNAKTVLDEYYMKRGNTGLAMYTVPEAITHTTIEKGGVVFQSQAELDYYESLRNLNEIKQGLRKDNPLVYSFMLAAEKNI